MHSHDNLFALSPNLQIRSDRLGGKVPVLLIDDFYQRPEHIREMALDLQFVPPTVPYPGKLAQVPPHYRSLQAPLAKAAELGRHYLAGHRISMRGKRLTAFRQVHTDFGVVDVHPEDLTPVQRLPHIDPVPLFGLVYLNREPRGGTMFFEQVANIPEEIGGRGYPTKESEHFRWLGRIEPVFNRLAIYPGFVPHSSEVGDWILGDERFQSPRLTQRVVFLP